MKTLPLSEYDAVKRQLVNSKNDFIVSSTTYTKTLTVKKQKFLFTDEPISPKLLKLINLSRTDGENYLKSNQIKPIDSKDIVFSKYTDNMEHEKIYKGFKIDLTSAYWAEALNLGIISESTDVYFQFNRLGKKDRLKALGSFATKRHEQEYKGGKMTHEEIVIYNDDLRNLYLYICEKIAKVMQIVSYKYRKESYYYYWDCLFFSDKVNPKEVQALIKRLGFSSTVEETSFGALKGKYLGKLIDINKEIEYPIRRTDY